MRRFTKVVAGGALGFALLVPSGMVMADDESTPETTQVCTQEEREERQAARDQLRNEVRAQLQEEGVTDPAQVREQLRERVHSEMEERYGEANGPRADDAGEHGYRTGPQDGSGPDRAMDGTGNR